MKITKILLLSVVLLAGCGISDVTNTGSGDISLEFNIPSGDLVLVPSTSSHYFDLSIKSLSEVDEWEKSKLSTEQLEFKINCETKEGINCEEHWEAEDLGARFKPSWIGVFKRIENGRTIPSLRDDWKAGFTLSPGKYFIMKSNYFSYIYFVNYVDRWRTKYLYYDRETRVNEEDPYVFTISYDELLEERQCLDLNHFQYGCEDVIYRYNGRPLSDGYEWIPFTADGGPTIDDYHSDLPQD